MTEREFISKLTTVFSQNGLGSYLSEEKSKAFYKLTQIMLEENSKYNLTAITDPDKIILNHYLDCAMPLAYIKKGAKIIDVGCGAGFPSLPFAILREDLNILAIDSTEKRINYVSSVMDILGLKNIKAIAMRAEDGGLDEKLRESFDFATARAVANMRLLSELCMPFVKVGGKFIAMKGKNAEYELKDAKTSIAILGGTKSTLEKLTIKDGGVAEEHPLIIIEKTKPTPKTYPRPYAKMLKKPL